jgi:hypothetical protein
MKITDSILLCIFMKDNVIRTYKLFKVSKLIRKKNLYGVICDA